jgi:hypothetical protein
MRTAALSIVVTAGLSLAGCRASSGVAPYGPLGCKASSKMSTLGLTQATPLGFTPQDFLSLVEVNGKSTPFEWVAYDASTVTSTSPAAGGRTHAVVSIQRTASPPRWFEATSPDCMSYLELDLDYSITTQDGLLAESIPVTLSKIDAFGEGIGETDLPVSAIAGSLRAAPATGQSPAMAFGIVVTSSQTFGGIQLRFQSGQSLFNFTLGRWPPVQ